MTIEPDSGQLRWLTQTPDVGSHQITIRATDQFGLFVEQRFDLRVVDQLANRPPIFTSEPDIDMFVSSPLRCILTRPVKAPQQQLCSHAFWPEIDCYCQ